jgi:cytochrome c biogenesis protein CcdA
VADHDPLTDARVRAREALRSDFWPSFKVAAWALVFGTGATAALAFALFDREFITRLALIWIIALGAAVSGVGVFFAQELRRLYERSAALKDLYESQKQYEILLRDARAERDQQAQANRELMSQNAALQTFFGVAAALRRSSGEENRE